MFILNEFIEGHNLNDGKKVLINTSDISTIEELNVGCAVHLKTVADDFDGTKHQVKVYLSENYDDVTRRLK